MDGRTAVVSELLLTLAVSRIYGISSGIRANYGILLGPISQNSGMAAIVGLKIKKPEAQEWP